MQQEKEGYQSVLYDPGFDYRPSKGEAAGDAGEYSALGSIPFKLKSREVLERVIADRVLFLKLAIQELNKLIQQRRTLRDELRAENTDDMLRVRNLLFEIESHAVVDQSVRSSLEGRIVELSKEKRHLELSHWRDTVLLKSELRKEEKELRSALLDLWMIRFLS